MARRRIILKEKLIALLSKLRYGDSLPLSIIYYCLKAESNIPKAGIRSVLYRNTNIFKPTYRGSGRYRLTAYGRTLI